MRSTVKLHKINTVWGAAAGSCGVQQSPPQSAAAADARAALDTALDRGAARCVDLVSTLIHRLDGRAEQPMGELREYARQRRSAQGS